MQSPIRTVSTSPTLRRLLSDHQKSCTADCCKERAFQITRGSILRWLESERIDRVGEIAEEIERIKADLQRTEGRVFLAARGLESDWASDDFKAFWVRFEEAFARAVEAREKTDAYLIHAAADRHLRRVLATVIGRLGGVVH